MYSALNSFGFNERDFENPETFKRMIDFLMKQEDIAKYEENFFTIRQLNRFSLERIKLEFRKKEEKKFCKFFV